MNPEKFSSPIWEMDVRVDQVASVSNDQVKALPLGQKRTIVGFAKHWQHLWARYSTYCYHNSIYHKYTLFRYANFRIDSLSLLAK